MFLGGLSAAALQYRLMFPGSRTAVTTWARCARHKDKGWACGSSRALGQPWSSAPSSCSKEGWACFVICWARQIPSGDSGCWTWKVSECKATGEAAVNPHSSSRHWKSVDTPKQWDMTIQKCELQEGVLPSLEPSRNLVVSGLRDPKETFISVTELDFMCHSFGRTLEEIWCTQGSGSYRSCFKPRV